MVPADSWEAVRTVRNLFPNGTGFYARGANTADRISAVGQQFRKAPAGVTQPYYSYDINQRDLRDVLAAVREGKMRSDFITVALHSHDFRDTRGGYRGLGIPEEEHDGDEDGHVECVLDVALGSGLHRSGGHCHVRLEHRQ